MLQITLRGLHRATSPRTAGPFVWNDEHGLHLWQGRALTAGEFNAFASSREWDRLIDLHGGLLQIRVVEDAVSPCGAAALDCVQPAAAFADGSPPPGPDCVPSERPESSPQPQPKARRTPAKKPKKRRSTKKKPRTTARP